ncbi:helix-turn-helix transcriptional regulator [Ruegeria atlantica]|uniref:AlpA family phage regulatory protein n=1 Tax=Ruegeria atlantica TaxID=81569 RepID=A0ABX1WEG1_9RHOB|nr:AlpA family phage regulatory protein [Ruegeria atlantica]
MSTFTATSAKYLTLMELREKLGNRSRSSIYADLAAERLPKPVKLGGRLLWIEEEIDSHLRALRDGDIC